MRKPKPATESESAPVPAGPSPLRRVLLVLVTALIVARPLVLGEDPGLADSLSDPLGMVLTQLWLVAAVVWAVWRFRHRLSTDDSRNWYGGAVQTALLITVALIFVSAYWGAHYKFPARLIAWEWFGLFVAFFVVRQTAVSEAEQHGLFTALLAGAVALAAHGLYQKWVEMPRTRQLAEDPQAFRKAWAEENPTEMVDEQFIENNRQRALQDNIYGPYAHPNSYAGYLALWLPGLIGAAAICWRTGRPRWQIVLAGGCAVLGLAALWLTHSRGAMLGLALAGLGVAAVCYQPIFRRRPLASLTTIVLLIALAYGAGRSGLLTAGMGKSSGTITVRLEYWRTTWQMIRERPWLGVGPGNFGENYTRLMPADAGENIKDPHNFALEMWATCGVFALLALLAALAVFFYIGASVGASVGWAEERGPPEEHGGPRNEAHPTDFASRYFYLGGVFGLLLALVLRAYGTSENNIIAEGQASALRAAVWLAAYALLERIAWADRGRALALTAGVTALLINLCVSGGIGFPSVAGPLWIAVALALNSGSLRPTRWLSESGPAFILPVPITLILALGYASAILYPMLASDGRLSEAVRVVSYFRGEQSKPPAERAAAIRANPDIYLRKHVIGPLEDAARLTPGFARLHVQLAWWYGQAWQLNLLQTRVSNQRYAAAALEHAKQAVRLDPDGGQGYLVQYQLHMVFGSTNLAIARMDANRDPIAARQKEVHAKEQFRTAAEALEPYLRNDPTDPRPRYSLADAWYKAGEAEKGREQAEEALRLDEIAAPLRKLSDRQHKQIEEWLRPTKND